MALPLTGIRVLDVTNVLAGPFCSYQLALMGAEVIKIEQPGTGDLARRLGADPAQTSKLMGASFVAVNAGKQSLTLNLKHEDGKKIFKQLTAQSHVVVENFRPGVMKRLGLDYSVLSKVNRSVVYCAISGFGQEGPLAMRPAYDQVIQGMAGVMSVTGDEYSAPLRVGFPVCDTVGGITAAFAITSALVGARTTGEGQMIDVSMLDASLATMGWVVSNYLNCGVIPKPMGNENFTASPSGTFRTADRPLNIAANEDSQYRSLCDLIGRPDLKTADVPQRRRMGAAHGGGWNSGGPRAHSSRNFGASSPCAAPFCHQLSRRRYGRRGPARDLRWLSTGWRSSQPRNTGSRALRAHRNLARQIGI